MTSNLHCNLDWKNGRVAYPVNESMPEPIPSAEYNLIFAFTEPERKVCSCELLRVSKFNSLHRRYRSITTLFNPLFVSKTTISNNVPSISQISRPIYFRLSRATTNM